jgi:methyl-accepting chemotaxis protein
MRLTIARKLWLAFAIVLVLLAVLAVLAVSTLNAARDAVAYLIEIHRVVEAVDLSTEQLLQERGALAEYYTTGDDQYSLEAQAARSAQSESWLIVKEYGVRQGVEVVQMVENAAFAYHGILETSVGIYESNPDDFTAAFQQLDIADDYYSYVYAPHRRELSADISAGVAAAQDYVGRQLAAMRAIAVVVGAVALVIATASSYVISRGITRAARHLSAAAESMSRGDLDVAIEVKTGDEMQDLAEALERMRASLKAAIERLRRRTSAETA